MVRPTDPSSWLFATVRTLLHRIEVLEGQKPFSFNPKAPVYFPHLPPGLHHAASKNFDFACLFHDLYYNAAAEPEILFAEGFDSQDAPLPDNIIQRSKNLSNNFIQRSKNLSVEVSDVPSPDNFIQFIDDNVDARSNPQQVEYIQQTQVDAAPQQVDYIQQTLDNNPLPDDGGGLLNQVEYIQQTQVENVQQASVKFAAPLTYAAPEMLPMAASMVAVPQQYQFAPATYAAPVTCAAPAV